MLMTDVVSKIAVVPGRLVTAGQPLLVNKKEAE